MEIKLALIDNSIDSSVYNPIRHWKPYLDVKYDVFKATRSHFPDLKKRYTHLILTGSEASILEREGWVFEEIEMVQEAVEKGLSVLGSCYGHHLLALALCGPNSVRRCTHPEVGWIPIQINENDNLFGNRKQGFSFSSHFDEVMNLGNDFAIIASSKHCLVQAFQLKKRAVWGLQAHPEINVAEGQRLLKRMVSLKLKAASYFEQALQQRPKDSGLIYPIIRRFLAY